MIVLHGLWSVDARLCLWGEDPAGVGGKAGRSRGRPTRPRLRPHPFAAGTAAVAGALEAFGHTTDEAETVPETALWLPSGTTGPLPSPGLPVTLAPEPGCDVWLAPWSVPTVPLAHGMALRLLLALPAEAAPRRPVSASLRLLAQVARLAIEIVSGGRVLPTLVPGPDPAGPPEARWTPVPSGADVVRLERMAGAAPPLLRAQRGPGTASTGSAAPPGPNPADIESSALASLVDAATRASLDGPLLAPRRGRRPRHVPAAELWAEALTTEDPAVDADPEDLALLAKTLDAWRRSGDGPGGPFRTCFRVAPPADDPGVDLVAEAAWHLEVVLQANDDPSLLVPAAHVWTSPGPLKVVDRVLADPQERLLADLGRVGRLHPPLEAILAHAQPSELELTSEETADFLAEAAPLLNTAGFGVIVPDWWRSASRLGARLRARPRGSSDTAATSTGLLGAEGLCDYRWEVALGDDTLTEGELAHLADLKRPLVRFRGRWVHVDGDDVAAALRLLRSPPDRDGMSLVDVLRVGAGAADAEAGLPVLGAEADDGDEDGWLAGILSGTTSEVEAVASPASLVGELRPYQARGLDWLAFMDRAGLGACLADDMGLGKTVQLLTLLLAEREQAGADAPAPTLLVCPMSLMGNWQRESERFAPTLALYVHHGGDRHGGDAFAEATAGADLVLTTYALATRDRALLAGVRWGRVVLDEAQAIKNSQAKQTRAVRAIPAPRRVALTGTPVENRLSELWSIMEFLNPGLLGPAKQFRERFAVPIERYRDKAAADVLRRVTQPFVLRRLKTDPTIISDLPDKIEMKEFCNLTREQASLYRSIVDDMLARIEASEGIQRRGLVLATMTRLKQVCDHPALLLGDGSALAERSGKLARLEEVLTAARDAGEKALVFTQYAEMGHLLTAHLGERLGEAVLFLHGGVPRTARDAMVASFQGEGGPGVFVLSLKAGGVGLNLTAANHVVHFDRWWNPAVENQATDRAFRIGQRKDVQVRKFVSVGTLEERIDEMIESKKDLAERIVGSGDAWLTELSTNEIRDLVVLSADAVAEA